VIALVRRVLARLESVCEDTIGVRDWIGAHREDLDEDPTLGGIFFAATDFWALLTASAVHRWTAGVAAGTITAPDGLLRQIDAWLEGFESGEPEEATVERAVDELLDILSLPTWGKRHELYSAWIATQLDRALDSRLEFVVTDGALRFPFRPTLLARLDTAQGPVELWCEVRSPATDELSGGRKESIQPDYRFQRAPRDTSSVRTTVAAVEAKQYKAPNATRHGHTLRDYVANLPDATVFLVGHGPLGGGVIDAVAESDRDRARVHPDVRVGRPRESAAFRADVARLFPPTATRPNRIELRWSPTVPDLDLHVRGDDQETSFQALETTHSTLRKDAFDGGPEIVDLHPDANEALEVCVQVYSTGTLRSAAPVVTFFRDATPVLELTPADEFAATGERWWDVARIDHAGGLTPSARSRQTPAGDGAR
jgi:hypothetical protein